ncbi:MAG TPA: plastocyanin/azurin family copper-binding protein [Solirubrobacteraceae bacterium]|nr:plastocyanin/azurin family copper-binding protein [Solirubrobacteraceae bacterium]
MRQLGALLGAGCLLFGVYGCGGVKRGEEANLITGKQEFVAKCGSCHTLARASTKGTVGPNLDEAFRASLDEGLERSAVQSVVEGQVENPNKFGAMPAKLASGTKLTSIAAYVAQAVDRPGQDTGLLASAVKAPGSGKPAVEKGGKLEIPADPTGQLSYLTNKASATAGSVAISMPNMSGVSHNIAVEAGSHAATPGGSVLAASQFVTKGTASINVQLKPGTYTFFCQAPGHRAAGMYGTIIVK